MKKIENKEKLLITEKPTQLKSTAKNGSRRKSLLIWITIGLLILSIAFILYWLLYLQFHESTDDAYANGSMVNINAAVQGSVIAFYADDTDLVKQGQLLVELDATPYQVNYEQELANLAATVLQVRQLYDSVLSSNAVLENRKISLSRAQFDFDNRSKLIDSLAVSNEDFIHAKDTLKSAELDLKQAEYQFRVALDAAGNTTIE
jgi:membrane fusion protein (multidrug efflux system)